MTALFDMRTHGKIAREKEVSRTALSMWRDGGGPGIESDVMFGAAFLEAFLPEIDLGGEVSQLTHARLQWAQVSCPTFRVSHGLLSSLLLTDCRGLVGDDVRFPFEAFALSLPTPSRILYEGSEGDEVHAQYVLFHRFTARTEAGDVWKWGIHLSGADICIVHKHTNEPKPAESVAARVYRAAEHRAPGTYLSVPLSGIDATASDAAYQLVVNFAVYLAGLGPLPTTRRKRRQAPAAVELLAPKVWEVGRDIKISSALHEAAVSTNRDRSRWRLRSRFVVRGHWRNQACGKRRKGRRRTWIAPFWKGPKNGPEILRNYYVEGAK